MVHTKDTIVAFRDAFYSTVAGAQHIAITAHISPDDDSIASVLSVYTILTKKFPEKRIRVIYTGEPVARYASFMHFDDIIFSSDNTNVLDGADLLVLLDCSKFSRSSQFPELLASVPTSICIDHHASPADEFSVALIDSSFSSNAELIYTALDAEQELDGPLAELFLLGILGDTGNLTHIAPHQTGVFPIVKRLVDIAQVRIDTFLSRFKTIPKSIIPILQELVQNTTFETIEGWPPVQYSTLARVSIESRNYSDEDISAAAHIYLSQYLPRIQGQSWGFVVTPRTDGSCRMSSRSLQGSVNVRVFHEQMGVGGGHDRASGAYISESDPSVWVEEVKAWMQKNQPVLD